MLVSEALFDPTRVYRYSLTRLWDRKGAFVAFVGLNPSRADEVQNDPTVTRCIKYAQRWGFGGMYMLNAFALRSTDPKRLYVVEDPVGLENDQVILEVCRLVEVTQIVACWGAMGLYRDRQRQLSMLLNGMELHCLGLTKDGCPRHPLYLRADLEPVLWV